MAGLCLVVALAGPVRAAGAPVAAPRDTLVYKDGDRVQGKLVKKDGAAIVFQSDRFGELRVPAADAVVIAAEKAVAKPTIARLGAAAPKAGEKMTDDERADEERLTVWERFSPSVLTAKVREFFGPWTGRLAMSTDIVSDSADRQLYSLDGQLKRKWEKDEVQFTARYDYAETNTVVTTDTVKAAGLWRHDFDRKRFAQYRPTAEWNHASKRAGVPNDYVLLQQEVGLGFTVLSKPTRKLRAGLSHNVFDVWNSAPTPNHSSRGVVSTFEEAEVTLPWRMNVTQRGVWYPVQNAADGWENRVELNKKLTETLSTSIRHEIRRNNPDGSSQDYTRMKVLLGLDF